MIDKKYFHIIDKENIKRSCPLCEMPLKQEEFEQQNPYTHLDLWYDKKVAIPCCLCLEILEKYSNSGCLEIQYPADISLASRALNNLHKFGIISVHLRDKTFRGYRN